MSSASPREEPRYLSTHFDRQQQAAKMLRSSLQRELPATNKPLTFKGTRTMHADCKLSTGTPRRFPGQQSSPWRTLAPYRTKTLPRLAGASGHRMLNPGVLTRTSKGGFPRQGKGSRRPGFSPRAVAGDITLLIARGSLVAATCLFVYGEDAPYWLTKKLANVGDAVRLYVGLKRMRQAKLLLRMGEYCKLLSLCISSS